MLLIALTGGIGSGKSSVAERLVARGAELIDADATVRGLQAPGEPVFAAMVERWGSRIVTAEGELDRQAVASIVFGDEAELAALNAIVHPVVAEVMAERIAALSQTERIVIQDIPLLAEGDGGRRGASAVIVVDCPIEMATKRLVEHRGFDRGDAEARIAAQASREERRALADFVVDNSGDLDHLTAEVERCWAWLSTLARTDWDPGS